MASQNKINIVHKDHTPWNKYAWQVEDGIAIIDIKDYDGTKANPDAWTEITLEEHYTPEGSKRRMSKTIHVTLSPDERQQLIDALTNHKD